MGRAFVRAFVFVVTLAALNCTEEGSGPTASDSVLELAGTGTCPNDIKELILALFPSASIGKGGLENAALQQCQNMQRQFSAGQTDDAIDKAADLVSFIMDHVDRLDPPSGMTKEEGSGGLISLILAFVGLGDGEPIPPGAFTEEGAVVQCQGTTECRVITGTEFAGFIKPPGVGFLRDGQPYDGPVTLFIERLSDTADPFESFGFDDFPLFYFIGVIPEVTLTDEIVAGVCVVDPPDPLAPPSETSPFLRLAHIVDEEVDVTELAAAAFLDCQGASTEGPTLSVASGRRLAQAEPGALGGRISSFSPFGAVDSRTGGGSTSGSISGMVTDAGNSEPLSGAAVRLLDGSGEVTLRTTTTNAFGDYSFSSVTLVGPSTDYFVHAAATGYNAASRLVTLTSSDPNETEADIALSPVSSGECQQVTIPAAAGGTAIAAGDGLPPEPTGVFVDNGDAVSISANGSITIFGSDPSFTNDPDGFDFSSATDFDFLLSDASAPNGESATVAGGLIGRVGTADFFYVGTSLVFTAHSSGEIELAINDIHSFFFDNLSQFSATVCVLPGPPPTPFTGLWVGTSIHPPTGYTWEIALDMVQGDETVSGSYNFTDLTGSGGSGAVPFSADIVNDNQLRFEGPASDGRPSTLILTLSGDVLSGEQVVLNADGSSEQWVWNLTRQ